MDDPADFDHSNLLECSSLQFENVDFKDDVSKSKRRKNTLKKKDAQEIGDVSWEYFNADKFIKNFKTDRLLIYGISGEGKSFFAAQLLIYKIISNMENGVKTVFESVSQSSEAEHLTECIGKILINLYPHLEATWNTEQAPIHVSHSGSLESMAKQLNTFKLMSNKNVVATEKIWFFDDIGTILSDTKRNVVNFFDDLCSRGRHYNISSIFCTQKLEVPRSILNSSIKAFVGNMCNVDFRKKCGFYLSSSDEFFKQYSARIGLKYSRNILVIDGNSPCVYIHKVPKEFVDIWSNLMKKNK
jgi:hypothetical protein